MYLTRSSRSLTVPGDTCSKEWSSREAAEPGGMHRALALDTEFCKSGRVPDLPPQVDHRHPADLVVAMVDHVLTLAGLPSRLRISTKPAAAPASTN